MHPHTRTHILITISSIASAALFTAALHFSLFSASLVVNTNMQSINALKNLNTTQKSLATVFERISSGLRINKAGDDAAGLGVSQSLDEEIRGLRQESRNVNDGVSLVQTAEGAANEIGNILKRMRELAVQSSSETLSQDEREYIDDEFSGLDTANEELYEVIDSLQWPDGAGNPISSGTIPSSTILQAQARYASYIETIADAIDSAIMDAEESEDTSMLLDQIDKSQQVLAIAQKDIAKTVEAVAKSAGQSAKSAERKFQDIERKSVVKPAAGARSSASKTKARKSATSSSATKKR